MANVKITALPAITTIAADDVLPIVDVSADITNKITLTQIQEANIAAGPTFDHIHLISGQIGFPATQVPSSDANTLDDYEEGTWTMGLTFGGLSTGITYNSNSGYYTKIGNVVTISGRMALTSKGSATGDAIITGLPFTLVNNLAGYIAVAMSFDVITFANQFQGYCNANTTIIYLNEITEAGLRSQLTNTDFADNSSLFINCTYRVA